MPPQQAAAAAAQRQARSRLLEIWIRFDPVVYSCLYPPRYKQGTPDGPHTSGTRWPPGRPSVDRHTRLVGYRHLSGLADDPVRHFTLSAHVTVAFQATYDAGVLLIYQHETAWAKLCCEYSPQHQPMIVSVVTNGRSDDANAVVLDQGRAFLRVTGLGDAFAFHYSLDGSTWQLVRYFALPQPDHVQVGFSVQAPTGSGCQADFAHIHYVAASVSDIRSGV